MAKESNHVEHLYTCSDQHNEIFIFNSSNPECSFFSLSSQPQSGAKNKSNSSIFLKTKLKTGMAGFFPGYNTGPMLGLNIVFKYPGGLIMNW